jgi:hypothetical protein
VIENQTPHADRHQQKHQKIHAMTRRLKVTRSGLKNLEEDLLGNIVRLRWLQLKLYVHPMNLLIVITNTHRQACVHQKQQVHWERDLIAAPNMHLAAIGILARIKDISMINFSKHARHARNEVIFLKINIFVETLKNLLKKN